MKSFFVSTAIDYPSEWPHLGHALEKIQADVIARYKRLQGFEVHFSTGTDDHGLKIQRYAQKAGKDPQKFVAAMSKHFKTLCEMLNISNNDFIRTSEKRHIKVAQEIIKKIYKKGDIYKGKYRGLYCVDCETYYLAKDLENDKCPIHKKTLEMIEEETYFFKMSKYQNQLIKHIRNNKNFIIPESKRNEILNRLKEPLQDLSISRATVKWGIPLPFDEKFSIFVWVEALINYLSTIDYPNKKFKEFWPADVHVIGKDIIWHHTVIWGSLLMSLGMPLPKTVFAHGFITVDGQKMSKSLGNIIEPKELVEKFGIDGTRYLLISSLAYSKDGDISWDKLTEKYNADLANGLGNLVSRVVSLIQNSKFKIQNRKSKLKIDSNKIKKLFQEFKLKEILDEIWKQVNWADKFIEKKKLWELVKKNPEQAKKDLSELLSLISEIGKAVTPFMPETSEKISKILKTGKTQVLFPRV